MPWGSKGPLCPVLIGRDAELETLSQALKVARDGDGQLAVLAGDAGMGKTRLASELEDRATSGGSSIMWGGCSEAGIAVPYLPFVEAIGNYLNRTNVAAVRKALGSGAGDLGRILPQISDDVRDEGTDPSRLRPRLFEAIAGLLRFAAGRHGLLVVLEDLHWADASTIEAVEYLTRRLRGARIMLLATCRTDEIHRRHPLAPVLAGWRRQGTVIDVAPLPARGIKDMVEAIMPLAEVPRATIDLLNERCAGNPFVLEETLKELMIGGDTPWQPHVVEDLRLPQTVSELILRRLAVLSDSERDVLRAAAVIGSSFDFDTLRRVADHPDASVRQTLERAAALLLVVEEAHGRGSYRFRHALTREAIYEDVVAPVRTELHARAAEALRQSGDAGSIARHLLAAGRTAEAIPMCLQAARDAFDRRAFAEAAALGVRALSLIEDGGEAARVRCLAGEAFRRAGKLATAIGYLEEGSAQLEEMGREHEAADHRRSLAMCYWHVGRRDDARAMLERTLPSLERHGANAALAEAYRSLAALSCFDYDFAPGLRFAERAISVAEQAGDDATRIWAYCFHGLALIHLQHPEEGLTQMERCWREAEQRGFPDIASNGLFNAGVMGLFHLRVRDSLSLVPRIKEAAPLSPSAILSARMLEGRALFLLGRIAEAEAAFQAAGELAVAEEALVIERWARRELAHVWIETLRLDEARKSLPPPAEELDRQDVLWGAVVRMRLHIVEGDVAAALPVAERILAEHAWTALWPHAVARTVEVFSAAGRFAEAERLIEAGCARPTRAHPHMLRSIGTLALAQGRHQPAIENLGSAAAQFAATGYRLDEMLTRLALMRALHLAGHDDAARSGAETVLRESDAIGAKAVHVAARTFASSIGMRVPATAVVAADTAQPSTLSGREIEVARLVSDGLTNRQIAERLVVSKRTVDAHVEHIRTKLGVRTRFQIAAWLRDRDASDR